MIRRPLLAMALLAAASAPAWGWDEPICQTAPHPICSTNERYVVDGERRQEIGIHLTASLDGEPLAAWMISDGRWSMPKRKNMRVRVQVDDHAPVTAIASTQEDMLIVYFRPTALRDLAEGRKFRVELPTGTIGYPLDGTAVAIARLVDAYAVASGATAADPFAATPAPPAPAASDPFGNAPGQRVRM